MTSALSSYDKKIATTMVSAIQQVLGAIHSMNENPHPCSLEAWRTGRWVELVSGNVTSWPPLHIQVTGARLTAILSLQDCPVGSSKEMPAHGLPCCDFGKHGSCVNQQRATHAGSGKWLCVLITHVCKGHTWGTP